MRRESRERYRVYSADEFLAALAVDRDAAPAAPDEADGARSTPAPTCARRRTRLAGATLLIGAIGSVGGLTAASMIDGQRHVRARRQSPARRTSAARAAARLERRAASAPRRSQSLAPTPDDRHVRRPSRAARPRSHLTADAQRARRIPAANRAELAAVRPSAGAQPHAPLPAHDGGGEFGFER